MERKWCTYVEGKSWAAIQVCVAKISGRLLCIMISMELVDSIMSMIRVGRLLNVCYRRSMQCSMFHRKRWRTNREWITLGGGRPSVERKSAKCV